MDERVALLLKRPLVPVPIDVNLYLENRIPSHQFTNSANGLTLLAATLQAIGTQSLRTTPLCGKGSAVITIDKTAKPWAIVTARA